MRDIIQVKNLTKNFGKSCAVCKINFNVKKGEIFGFLGPNGSGKTTTIRMLTTLLRPTSGSAKISGLGVVENSDQVREHIGLVAEKIILYNRLTAKENLEFFGQLYGLSKKTVDERAKKWTEKLHMTEWLNLQVNTFSTGMKQRINIVRALLTEPEILFLDEPTLGLDPQTTHLIRKFISELNKEGITIILTTHDMIEAEALSHRVAIINHGKIVALDTVKKLKTQVKNKPNPTLEDVFLSITGARTRDIARKKQPIAMQGHVFGSSKTNRIR